MIDDDDVSFAILAWPSGGGWIGFLLFALLIGGLAYFACQNNQECEAKTCPAGGHPMLIKHECVCVGKPVPP